MNETGAALNLIENNMKDDRFENKEYREFCQVVKQIGQTAESIKEIQNKLLDKLISQLKDLNYYYMNENKLIVYLKADDVLKLISKLQNPTSGKRL